MKEIRDTYLASLIIGVLIFIALVIIRCSKNQQIPAENEVFIENFAFNPASDTVPPGTTVRWINKDAVTHVIMSGIPAHPDSLFESGDLAQNDTFEYIFDSTGVFPYYCTIHPSMTGVITVR